MEYDLSYDDSPSLKQTLADLLRGMSKKQAYQELGQGIQNVAQIIPSVTESVGRGSLAPIVGSMGDVRDLRNTIQSYLPKSVQNVSNIAEFMANPLSKTVQQIAPTSQQTLNAIPRINPDYQGSQQHEMVGGLISPAMPYLLRAGAKSMQNVPIGNMIKEAQSSFVPNVEAGQEMIVKHNLTPEKLMAADRLGAMPVPSLGITKTKYDDPLSAFGDITLVGGKEMAIPSRANPVYSADAYTVRRPDIYTKTDEKANKFLRAKLSEPYGSLAKESDVMGEITGTLQNLDRNLENSSLLKVKYLESQGLLPNPTEFKTAREFRMAVRNQFDQLPQEELTKFYDWQPDYIAQLRNEAVQAGGTIKDQLFKGRSNVTGRELYEPATVENIVKTMSKAKPGDEGNFYTAGSLRGKLVPKLKNERDIQKSRDKIISNSAFEAFKDDISNTHNKLNSELNRFLVENKSGVDANALLEEIAMGTTNKYEYSRELAKKVPQDLKDRIAAYAKELKEAPTGYFEIKPKRAIRIGEFKGAIVPSDVSPKTMSILEKNGIKEIYKYSNIDERKSLIQKFGKEMFAGVPIIGLSRKEQLEEQFNNIKK